MTPATRNPIPAEVSALLEADTVESQDSAWQTVLERYTLLIRHTTAERGSDYDRTMDGYAFVLEQLRRDDYRRLRRYRAGGTSRFSTWLVVVVRRLCLDYHRQRYGRFEAVDANGRPADDRAARRRLVDLEGDSESLPALPDTGSPSITTEFSRGEARLALGREVEALDLRDRQLLKLRFEEGLAAREIAGRLGFESASQVYRRLDQVLFSLREKLRRAGIESAA